MWAERGETFSLFLKVSFLLRKRTMGVRLKPLWTQTAAKASSVSSSIVCGDRTDRQNAVSRSHFPFSLYQQSVSFYLHSLPTVSLTFPSVSSNSQSHFPVSL